MSKFIIYSRQDTPRIQYAMDIIFKIILETDYELTTQKGDYQQSKSHRINYGGDPICTDETYLPACDFLLQKDIRPLSIDVKHDLEIPYFFATNEVGVFPFDLPALVFYLVTRYEEYLPFEADIHQRFGAAESLAYKHNFLDRPIVDEWVLKLRDHLLQKLPGIELARSPFQFQPTYDVDYAWAYQNKGWRFWAGLANDLKLNRKPLFKQRLKVKLGREKDPYFFFDTYEKAHLRMHPRPIFFFLLGNGSAYDKNIRWNHPKMQSLLKQLGKNFELGIHPSYLSNEKTNWVSEECKRLEKTLHRPTTRSRQHYLKLRFPATYQQLLLVGIQHDYTMGYADVPGFRASIARPFPWYDLSKESATSLTIHPFQVMDVTLSKYLQCSPEVAFERCNNLLTTTKKVEGEFVTLWHNSSFSPIHGWTKEWTDGYWAFVNEHI